MYTGTQFTRIGIVSLKPGTADEAIRRIEAGLLPIFQAQQGFVAYSIAKTDEKSLVSLSIWQHHEQADRASQLSASWVKDTAQDLVESVQNHVGELSFFSASPDLKSYSTTGPVMPMGVPTGPVAGQVAKN
jgi:hypothetical protein